MQDQLPEMWDKTQGTVPLESPPRWGFVLLGFLGCACRMRCFPSSKGMLSLPKEGLSSGRDPLFLAATGIWALGGEYTAAATGTAWE